MDHITNPIHTGANLLHEAYFKFTGPIRSEISFDHGQFETVKHFGGSQLRQMTRNVVRQIEKS